MSQVDHSRTRTRSGKTNVKAPELEEQNKENDSLVSNENARKYCIPEGLSKMQKKNMRKLLRNKEKKAEQKLEESKLTEENDFAPDERALLYDDLSKRVAELPSLQGVPVTKFAEAFQAQEEIMSQLFQSVTEAIDSCKKVKKKSLAFSSQNIKEQKKNLLNATIVDQEAVSYLDEQLQEALICENARKFLPLFIKLLEDLELRRKTSYKLNETAQHQTKLGEVVKQIEDMKKAKGATLNKIPPSSIVSQEVEVSVDAWNVVGVVANIMRRLEKIYSVVLERAPNRTRTFTVLGLELDIKDFIQFITSSNFTTPSQIQLDSHVMPSFVGAAGSALKNLEQKLKCLLVIKNSNVVLIYGLKLNSKIALEHIKTTYMNDAANQYQVALEIPVKPEIIKGFLCQNYQNLLRNLESEHSVSIRLVESQRDNTKANTEQSQQSGKNTKQKKTDGKLEDNKIMVRGKFKSAENAKKVIETFISSLRMMSFEVGSPDILNRLFSKVSQSRGNQQQPLGGASGPQTRSKTAGKTSPKAQEALKNNDIQLKRKLTPHQSAAEEFSLLTRLNDAVAFFKATSTTLCLLGTQEELNQLKAKVQGFINSASIVPSMATVSNDLSFLFTSERVASIEFHTKCTVIRTFQRSSNKVLFEIYGSEEQKALAEAQFQDIINNEGYEESLTLDENIAKHLFKSSRKALLDLESQYGVHILVDRTTFESRVIGSKENVAAGIEGLKQLGNKLSEKETNLHVINVAIPTREVIPSIIGSKGAVINEIKEKSGVESIKIDDENLNIKITGLGLSCSVAEGMLNNIIEKRSRDFGSSNFDMRANDAKKVDTETERVPATAEAALVIEAASFPTLNEAAELRKSKRLAVRRKKATESGLRV